MPQHWEEVYEMALLETDQQKLAERIDVALVVFNNSARNWRFTRRQLRERVD